MSGQSGMRCDTPAFAKYEKDSRNVCVVQHNITLMVVLKAASR